MAGSDRKTGDKRIWSNGRHFAFASAWASRRVGGMSIIIIIIIWDTPFPLGHRFFLFFSVLSVHHSFIPFISGFLGSVVPRGWAQSSRQIGSIDRLQLDWWCACVCVSARTSPGLCLLACSGYPPSIHRHTISIPTPYRQFLLNTDTLSRLLKRLEARPTGSQDKTRSQARGGIQGIAMGWQGHGRIWMDG